MSENEKKKKKWKLDLKQSPANLIISRYGRNLGKKIVHVIQDSVAEEMEKEAIMRHLEEVFKKEIKEGTINKRNLVIIMDVMDNYETIGR
ncbi:MAG: hypothetical protein ACFFE5_10180 [Candidatus Thorarchaeota archaeon]